MAGIGLQAKTKELINECVGYDCKSHDGYNVAMQKIATEYKELKNKPTPSGTETHNKLKGKFKANKSMSVEHKTEDISELVRKEVEKATKGTQQTTQTQEHPHKTHLEAMPPGVNFLNCKNCGKMPNPRGLTKKFKKCDNCGANAVHPDAEVCPFCGNGDKEQFDVEEGIEIEDE